MTMNRHPAALSLVVPTRNRPDFLCRLLEYYQRQNCAKAIIIVADSSEEPSAAQVARIVEASSQRLNIKLQSYDQELGVVEKISDALGSVETPFVCMVADDDFFISRALERGVAFLEDNPDCASAHGEALVFVTQQDAVCGQLAWVGQYVAQRSLLQPTATERILAHLGNYSAIFYSVYRTEQHSSLWKKAAGLPPDMYFGELIPSCLSVIQGKVKKLSELFNVRQSHAEMAAHKAEPPMDWLSHSDWSAQYRRFRECIGGAIAEQDNVPLDQARATVNAAFSQYLARWMSPPVKEEVQPAQSHDGIRAVLRRVPLAGRTWRAVRRAFLKRVPLPGPLAGAAPYEADFLPIYEIITGTGPAHGKILGNFMHHRSRKIGLSSQLFL